MLEKLIRGALREVAPPSELSADEAKEKFGVLEEDVDAKNGRCFEAEREGKTKMVALDTSIVIDKITKREEVRENITIVTLIEYRSNKHKQSDCTRTALKI